MFIFYISGAEAKLKQKVQSLLICYFIILLEFTTVHCLIFCCNLNNNEL